MGRSHLGTCPATTMNTRGRPRPQCGVFLEFRGIIQSKSFGWRKWMQCPSCLIWVGCDAQGGIRIVTRDAPPQLSRSALETLARLDEQAQRQADAEGLTDEDGERLLRAALVLTQRSSNAEPTSGFSPGLDQTVATTGQFAQ